jgi:ribose transport system permease protein
MKIKTWVGHHSWIWSIAVSIFIWILISCISGRLAFDTLLLNATLASFLVLIGFGQMTVITSGDGAIDLSMPYVVTLCGYVSSSLMGGDNIHLLLGICLTLLLSVVIGLVNGLIIVKLRVPAIITTLATGYIIFSGILMYAAHSTGLPNPVVASFTRFNFHGFSSLTLFSLALAGIMAVILYRAKIGKQLHAVGQSRRAAELAGIRSSKIIVYSFIFSAFMGGVTGILLGAFIGGAFMEMGNAYLMTSIAAVLVGGTLASGGKSSVIGVLGGSLLLTLVVTFLTLTKLSAGYQNLIEGAILILILVASDTKKSAV